MNSLTDSKLVKAFMCDRFGLLRPVILMNELQGLADTHADLLNIGRDFCIKNNVTWVVIFYSIDIIKNPKENDKLFFETWVYDIGNLKTIRNFQISNEIGEVFINISSQWILLDINTRKPLPINRFIKDFSNINSKSLDLELHKIEDFITQKKHIFKCRFDDIDVNQHINNSVYINWAVESVGFDFRNKNILDKIYINFKKEIPMNISEVFINVKIDNNVSYHSIIASGLERARIKCFWTKRI